MVGDPVRKRRSWGISLCIKRSNANLPSRKHDVIVMAAVLQTIVRSFVSFAPVTSFSAEKATYMDSFLGTGVELGRRLQAKDMKDDTLDRDGPTAVGQSKRQRTLVAATAALGHVPSGVVPVASG